MSGDSTIPAAVYARYLEVRGWDNGEGYSFQPWIKSCGANVQKLKPKGVEHLADRPRGSWRDGEWVEER